MTTYYVSSQIGNANNAGTSAASPLATLQAAANLVKPGDTVEVMNGTYTGPQGGAVLDITTSGTASAPITFEAAPGQSPVIDSSGTWNGIDIQASYVVVKGFTVVGEAPKYNLQTALAGYSTGNPNLDGSGIAVNPSSSVPLPHHITIANNTVYNEPGGGIYTVGADYVQILNNTVHDNAHWSAYGNSGISVFTSKNSDTKAGVHDIISGNLSFNNAQLVPSVGLGKVTDGEGIILDTNTGYTGQIVVQNNTTYGNGGPGIESYLTANAVISGNTVYGNNTQHTQAPGDSAIFINQSSGNTVTNNVTTAPVSAPPPAPPPATSPVAPKIVSFSPDSGVSGDGLTNANTVTLSGSAVANSIVKVFDGTTPVGTANVDGSGGWTVTAANLAAGSHRFTATDTVSGATSSASQPLSVTVDRLAPAAPVLTGESVVNANHVLVTGTAEANSSLQLFDGATSVGTAAVNSSGAWSMTTGPLAAGSHSFTAKATDAAGNTGLASAALAVTISSAPNTAPAPNTTPAAPTIASFSSDTGVVGDHITSDNTPTLAGIAAANSTVTLFDGKSQVGHTTADSSGHWSLTAAALSDGAHTLTTTDTDSSGHTSSPSPALALTIDTHVPAAPTMAIYSQGGATLGATATVNDLVLRGVAEGNSTIDIFDAGKQIGTANAGSSGAWSFDTGHIASGSHSFTAAAVDVAGTTGHVSAADAISLMVSTTQGTPATPSSGGGVATGGAQGQPHTGVGDPAHAFNPGDLSFNHLLSGDVQAIATLISDLHNLQRSGSSHGDIIEALFDGELHGGTNTLRAELTAMVNGVHAGNAALAGSAGGEMHALAAEVGGSPVHLAGGTHDAHALMSVVDMLSMTPAAAPSFGPRSHDWAAAPPAASVDAAGGLTGAGAAEPHHSPFEMAHHFQHLWG